MPAARIRPQHRKAPVPIHKITLKAELVPEIRLGGSFDRNSQDDTALEYRSCKIGLNKKQAESGRRSIPIIKAKYIQLRIRMIGVAAKYLLRFGPLLLKTAFESGSLCERTFLCLARLSSLPALYSILRNLTARTNK